jgi:phosphoribosyl 1,2-cyclic phosphodiesterase
LVKTLAVGDRNQILQRSVFCTNFPQDRNSRMSRAMTVQFAVLASGSRGNSTLVCGREAGLLIDAGIGPKALGERLKSVGSGWSRIGAVVLTHTHADHVDSSTFLELARRGINLHCHERHRDALADDAGFLRLEAAGLIRFYDDHPFLATIGLRVEPITLRHDGGPTFGFRIEASAQRREPPVSLGYVADTGCWTESMADCLTDVDLLGIEFNHDVGLQRASRRPQFLIQRNLGDDGHLSNSQGAELLAAVLKKSRAGTIRHVVLLHLSEQCNQPDLAISAAQDALRTARRQSEVHAAEQCLPFPNLQVVPHRARPRAGARALEPASPQRAQSPPAPDRSRDVAGHFGWDADQDPTALGTI